jgi:hypothetical protein
MSDTCPTVKVTAQNSKGFRIINEADFDPEKHELFAGEVAQVKQPKTPEPETPVAETVVATPWGEPVVPPKPASKTKRR